MPILTKGAKEIHEECDQSEMCIVLLGNVVAHTGRQQRPEHVREGKQQKSATAEGVNSPDGWPSKQEVDESKSERGNQSFLLGRTALLENGGGIERDDVDYTR